MTGDDTTPERLDEVLLDELRQVVDAADPVPGRLIEGAKAAFSWRTVDQELALLQFDSLADPELAVRSTGTVRLSFATDQAVIEVEIDQRGLVGQIAPRADRLCVVPRSGAPVDVTVDDVGQFATDRPASGPIRLEATVGERVVVTEWFAV